MAEIRVALVDDHSIFRQGLRAMLAREAGLQVVGEAADAASALAMVERSRPHVVLLDLKISRASESDGLVLCPQLSLRCPDSRILILTTFVEEWLVLEAIKQGAKGYVVKDIELLELIRAIRAVHRGESAFDAHSASVWVPRTLSRPLISAFATSRPRSHGSQAAQQDRSPWPFDSPT